MYDVAAGLPVLLEDGTRKYVWGLGLAYAVTGSGTSEAIEVYHTDGLGSVRAMTDGSAQVVETYRTDEFGVPIETAGTRNQPFEYTVVQKAYDAAGKLVHFDPKTPPLNLDRGGN